jgi:hypothetical protein
VKRREEVYRAYWHLASERQAIFERRLARKEPPWSDDPILREYKFTNAFRASDRVSQFLIGRVIRVDDDFTPEDVLVRVVLFRLFSREETWTALESQLGAIRQATLHNPRLPEALEELQARGSVYTSAFILCANKAYGHDRKYLNHLELLREMVRGGRLPRAVARATKLKAVYDALTEFPLIGPFMAYQLAIDINYSDLTDFPEDGFTVAGPGAARGIRKVFPDATPREFTGIIHRMVDEQELGCSLIGAAPPTLLGRRRLRAIDCQNLFCELDKYARVAFPHLKSNRTRIKAKFSPSAEPLALVYPESWDLDDVVRTPATLAA